MSCKYCSGEVKASNSAFGLYNSNGKWYISTEETDTEIFFCPICGQDLKAGANGNT